MKPMKKNSVSIFRGLVIALSPVALSAQILVEDFSSNDFTGSGQTGSAAPTAWITHVAGGGTPSAASGAAVLTAGPNSGNAVDFVSAAAVLTDNFTLSFTMDPNLSGFSNNQGPGVMFGMTSSAAIGPATASEAYFVSQINGWTGTQFRMLYNTSSTAGWETDQQGVSVVGSAWEDQNTFSYDVSYDSNTNTSMIDVSINGTTVTSSLSFTGSFAGTHVGWYVTDGGSDATNVQTTFDNISIIPEPGTYALLLGAIVLGFAATRRRIS